MQIHRTTSYPHTQRICLLCQGRKKRDRKREDRVRLRDEIFFFKYHLMHFFFKYLIYLLLLFALKINLYTQTSTLKYQYFLLTLILT